MRKHGVEKRIFWLSLILVAAICAPLLLGPEQGTAILDGILSFITGNFGWLYMWFAIAVFGLLVYLAVGKYGRLKFGDSDTRPEFSTTSWIAMLFTTGIGSGIMYWGVIEWAYYYTAPPFGLEPGSVEAGNWAATYGMFHWGFTAWAIYCLPALPIAYAFYVRKQPILRLSAACRGILGDHADGWVGKIIDVFFVFGLIGAVGTSLGLATPMISEGLGELTGITQGITLDAGIIVVWTAIFGISAYLGLQKGLKRLSDLNVYLALALGVFIIVAGPTVFILTTFTNSVGLLLQNFVQMSFYMDPIRDSGFTETWTVFYWGWWIAYAPFVGLFAARISRGRTMREVILAMCLAGSLGTWSAFAILGNTSLYFEINNVVPVTDILENEGAPAAIIATITALPLGGLVLVVFLVLAMIFLATMLDSASFALASVASREIGPDEEPPRWHRLFWAATLGAVAIVMMYGGGLEPLQTLTVISAFPLLFILILMVLSFRKWLINDKAEFGGPPSMEAENADTPEPVATGDEQKIVSTGQKQRR